MSDGASGPTLLVLRALGLGDFFTGLPALALLRAACPGLRIVLAVPPAFWPFALSAGTVDGCCTGHELEPLTGAPFRPALAVDLHGNGPASRALLQATCPDRLLAFDSDGGPRWRPGEYEPRRWCRLVGEGLDIAPPWPDDVAGRLPVPDVQAEAGLTLVHCGAKSAARRWPAARFAAVASRLREQGHQVVITGSPAEAGRAAKIADASRTRAKTTMSLGELFATVAAARLVVCGDTGIAHVASNYRTPSVVLFGPVSPVAWGPPVDPRHQVLWYGDGTGDPHGARPDPALLRVQVDEVVEACARVRGGAPSPTG